MRWVFRRRANRVIDEVNQRLALRIPSFKITKREVLIDRLVYDQRVMQAVEEEAQREGIPRDAVMNSVRTYAREIVPAFNAFMYFKFGYWLARRLVHMLYRVRLGFADDASLSELEPDTSVVFLMNHRSNMDYILATYLAAERTALSYAVGEWARVWPLQQLIRMMGGYFVRRDSGNPLYRRVLEVYVNMAAKGGVPQAVFMEGGLSRDGRLGKPKLGLLGYITRGFNLDSDRDIVFVPVGINYDRVLEDRTLLRTRDRKQARRTPFFTLGKTIRFLGKNVWLALTGRWYRNGYACVNFGTPLSLRDWLQQKELENGTTGRDDTDDVSDLANTLNQRIGDVIPVLPVAMVATIFCDSGTTSLTHLELKNRIFNLAHQLEAQGRHIYVPRKNLDYAVTVGVRMLTLRHALTDDDGTLSVAPEGTELLGYYAASIEHLLPVTAQSSATQQSVATP